MDIGVRTPCLPAREVTCRRREVNCSRATWPAFPDETGPFPLVEPNANALVSRPHRAHDPAVAPYRAARWRLHRRARDPHPSHAAARPGAHAPGSGGDHAARRGRHERVVGSSLVGGHRRAGVGRGAGWLPDPVYPDDHRHPNGLDPVPALDRIRGRFAGTRRRSPAGCRRRQGSASLVVRLARG